MVAAKFTIKDVAVIGVCAGLMTALKFAMSSLPNVEPVTLLVILFTQAFGKKTLPMIYCFVLLEGVIYGFHLWWFSYLYIWAILYFVVRAMGEIESAWVWALVAAIFGLLFGVLTSLPYWVTAGPAGALAWISSGLLFDLLHCAGNFIIVVLAWKPLHVGLQHLLQRQGGTLPPP